MDYKAIMVQSENGKYVNFLLVDEKGNQGLVNLKQLQILRNQGSKIKGLAISLDGSDTVKVINKSIKIIETTKTDLLYDNMIKYVNTYLGSCKVCEQKMYGSIDEEMGRALYMIEFLSKDSINQNSLQIFCEKVKQECGIYHPIFNLQNDMLLIEFMT